MVSLALLLRPSTMPLENAFLAREVVQDQRTVRA